MSNMLEAILKQYDIDETCTVTAFGSGLINNTWKIIYKSEAYILQRVNNAVFKNPFAIAKNVDAVGVYLDKHYPNYLFVKPLPSKDGSTVVFDKAHGYFRLMPFLKNSFTYNVAENTKTAFEAAKQFGRFTKLLAGFHAQTLEITLPDFHNLSLRYKQFLEALENGNAERISNAAELIKKAKVHQQIVRQFEHIKHDDDFKIRVTHHDTKISNVLFDEAGNGLCVIDLDTVMPGYFISDLGDMMRTYISPVSEEEQDLEKIIVRDEYVETIARGYLDEMKDKLTIAEKNNLLYAGKFMIYMQALRFLTDYLNNDIYYKPAYTMHNYNRAANQFVLLEKLVEKEEALQKLFSSIAA